MPPAVATRRIKTGATPPFAVVEDGVNDVVEEAAPHEVDAVTPRAAQVLDTAAPRVSVGPVARVATHVARDSAGATARAGRATIARVP